MWFVFQIFLALAFFLITIISLKEILEILEAEEEEYPEQLFRKYLLF